MKLKVFFSLLFVGLVTVDFGYSGGVGTETDPYLIANKADLLSLGINTNDYDKFFQMTADIDLSGTNFTKAVIAADISDSYDFQGTSFDGTFDGNGHVIRNVSIDTAGAGTDYLGLFGKISGSINKLGVENIIINGGDHSDYLSGLCGYKYRCTISDCCWNIETSGMTTSSGGIGKKTVQMQTQSTFTSAGWNFVDIWYMAGYPELRGFISVGRAAYQNWLIDLGVSVNEQSYLDAPAGDGIQNLLKYAIGLNPMQLCSTADVMEPLVETNEFGIIFHKSKSAEDVELFPTWTDSLIVTNWGTNGFEYVLMSETASNETWKAALPMTNDCGYIRLNAKTTD